ncbi:MAG TPA: hypothetical protein VF192_04000 [Longimicrobiales bacterium]
MNIDSRVTHLAFGLSLLLASPQALFAQDAEEPARQKGFRYGIAVAAAASVSPLGELAERHGIYGVPGRQYEVRLLARAPNRGVWSLALILDDFHIGQQLDRQTSYTFDYESWSLVAGYRLDLPLGGVRALYGVDAGWINFGARARSIDYYTGEPYASRTDGHGALLASWVGLALPGELFVTVPRVRMEINFPDFGGGDGYSVLHRETDVGLKVSVGLALEFADLF